MQTIRFSALWQRGFPSRCVRMTQYRCAPPLVVSMQLRTPWVFPPMTCWALPGMPFARHSLRRSSARNCCANHCLSEFEEFHRVTGPDALFVSLGHVGVDLVNKAAAVVPFALNVGKVGGKHNAVYPPMLPLLHRHPLVLHAKVDVLPDIRAG